MWLKIKIIFYKIFLRKEYDYYSKLIPKALKAAVNDSLYPEGNIPDEFTGFEKHIKDFEAAKKLWFKLTDPKNPIPSEYQGLDKIIKIK